MTPEEQKAFEDRIYSYVGVTVCERTAAKDAINPAMIRHWAEAMGDTNPAYTDEAWAAQSKRGKTIAPPAMMYAWNQEGFPAATGRACPGHRVAADNTIVHYNSVCVDAAAVCSAVTRRISIIAYRMVIVDRTVG